MARLRSGDIASALNLKQSCSDAQFELAWRSCINIQDSPILSSCATTRNTTAYPRISPNTSKPSIAQIPKMDRLNRMLASAGGMGGLNSAAPGSVSLSFI